MKKMVKKTKAGAEALTPATLLHNLPNPITATSTTAAKIQKKRENITIIA